jgi:hypothetical protein
MVVIKGNATWLLLLLLLRCCCISPPLVELLEVA